MYTMDIQGKKKKAPVRDMDWVPELQSFFLRDVGSI